MTVLPGAFDIHGVLALRADLLRALDERRRIEIDGLGVQSADTAAIQLLVAVAAEARLRGLSFSLRASNELLDAVLLMGAGRLIGISTPPTTAKREG